MSDMLLPERLHQALVQLFLDRYSVLRRIIKCQHMLLHFRGNFTDGVEVMLQYSRSATPAVICIYDRLTE